MKILGTVILYNTNENDINNYLSYYELVDGLLIIDNSDDGIVREKFFDMKNKISYKKYNENRGIAYALKDAAMYALENKYDVLLTMDQDSVFPQKYINLIRKKIMNYMDSNVGIITLNHSENEHFEEIKQINIKKVKNVISSGSFIFLKNYKKISGFNENLFIDYVDFDLNRQFNKNGFIILQIENIFLKHTVGTPKKRRFLFFNIESMNHNPTRIYYYYRNGNYLYYHNRLYYFHKRITLFINYLKMIYVDDDVDQKKKMVKLAKKHAKQGVLGKLKFD